MAEDKKAPRVRWAVGYTINLGNFQSLRLDCEIEDSVFPDETIEEGSDRIWGIAEEQLAVKVKEVKTEINGSDS